MFLTCLSCIVFNCAAKQALKAHSTECGNWAVKGKNKWTNASLLLFHFSPWPAADSEDDTPEATQTAVNEEAQPTTPAQDEVNTIF